MHEIIYNYPQLKFAKGSQFVWSPNEQTVYYDKKEYDSPKGGLALLHEIGHAELGHCDYVTDIGLLNMEMDAWEFAIEQAPRYGVAIDEAHIDRCMETYRLWLYKRSRCPACEFHGIQTEATKYRCFMCRHVWSVARTLSLQPNRTHCHSLATQ